LILRPEDGGGGAVGERAPREGLWGAPSLFWADLEGVSGGIDIVILVPRNFFF